MQVERSQLEGQPDNAAVTTGRKIAACMVARQPSRVDALLAQTNVAGLQAAWKFLKGPAEGCLFNAVEADADLFFSSNMIRSLLAEARFQRTGPARLSAADYSSVVEGSDWVTDNPGSKVVLRTADCVAVRKPSETADLLATPPGGAEERAAFAALVQALGTCLEAGVTLKANRTGMRLALASALDRRTRTTAAAGAEAAE
jgi:hypothetical protein